MAKNDRVSPETCPEFWSGRPVLVTGATGFVGSHLVERLLSLNSRVVALVRDFNPQSWLFRSGNLSRVIVVSGRLEDYWSFERALNEYEIDTVFHLGAMAIVGAAQRSPLPIFESNIRGTYNVLEACRDHQDLVKRVIVASSDKAYGIPESLPYTEEMPVAGRFPYDVSKSCTDLIARSYYHSHGLPVTVSRCGNIYGGGDLNWSRIVPGTIRSFLRGEKPILRSDGTFLRDYIYVKDVVRSYLKLAEETTEDGIAGKAFNFGPDKPYSVIDIVGKIAEIMDCDDLSPIIQNSTSGEIKDQYLNSDLAKDKLGWKPTYSIEAGLAETVDWYREHFNQKKESSSGVVPVV